MIAFAEVCHTQNPTETNDTLRDAGHAPFDSAQLKIKGRQVRYHDKDISEAELRIEPLRYSDQR